MRPTSAISRFGAIAILLGGTLVSCGGATGEGAAAVKASAAPVAAATAAPVAAPKLLILQGDTVRSPEGLTDEQKAYLSCVQQSRFPQGSRIVWRFRALDPLTAKALDDKAIKTFDLVLPDGKTSAFKYGGHGGTKEAPAEFFWTAGFSVPATYPTGLFGYSIKVVGSEGATGSFDQFKVPAAQLTIVPAGKL